MFRRLSSLLAISSLSASLAACASAASFGLLSDYIGTSPSNVTTSCGGGYQVYRRKGEPKLLVRAYEIPEIYQSMCEARRGVTPISITGVRHEEAVIEYLAQAKYLAPDLQSCRVVSGIEITRLHSEFTLACPVAPATAISVKG